MYMVPAAVLLATAASSAEAETSRANYTRYSPVDTAALPPSASTCIHTQEITRTQ